MQYYYKTEIKGIFDTMTAEQVINSEKFATGLAAVVFKYTGIVLDKEQQKSFADMRPMEMFTKEQLDYAARDVDVLFPVYEAQKIKLKETGQERIAEIEFELAGTVAAMEIEGIPINTKMWRKILEDTNVEHKQSSDKMHSLIYDDNPNLTEQVGMFERASINLGSPKQVAVALMSLGIELEKTPKGNWKTDERSLSRIDHEAARELLNYRGLQKIISAYGESFLGHIHPFTGRIHPDFQQIGTETGRFSCREPNVQQIPIAFRACVGGVKDYKIISADYANMELRIIAELSNDPALLKAFAMGDDPHKSTAAVMFNIPIDKVTKEERFIAKTINFGLTYGMGAPKLRDMLNEGKPPKARLSFPKVYAIVNQYKDTYRGVTQYFNDSGGDAFRSGKSETMLGRKRYFERPSGVSEAVFDQQMKAIKRQGGNAPIQGTNADVTKLAMSNLHEDFKEYGFRAAIINQVHDEIVVLAHKSHAETVKEVVRESMLNSAQEVLKKVPVKVDVNVSDYWEKG